MGQNSSHSQSFSAPPQTDPVDLGLRKRRAPPRPKSVPLEPKKPTYAVPENRVLPIIQPKDLKLRAVSLELSKFNPEYANVFLKKDSIDDDRDQIAIFKYESTSPDFAKKKLKETDETSNVIIRNGHTSPDVVNDNHVVPVSPENASKHPENSVEIISKSALNDSGIIAGVTVGSFETFPNSSLTNGNHVSLRTNSLDRNRKSQPHKRAPSVANSFISSEDTIFEDPSEYGSEHGRQALNLSYPSGSLPQKATFSLELPYNHTYAQLAKHRRIERIAKIQKEADDLILLELKNRSKENLLERQTSKASTLSSDSNDSVKKKKAAPLPPSESNSNSKADSRLKPLSNSRSKFPKPEDPPVDYDIEYSPPEIRATKQQATTAPAPKTKTVSPPPVLPKSYKTRGNQLKSPTTKAPVIYSQQDAKSLKPIESVMTPPKKFMDSVETESNLSNIELIPPPPQFSDSQPAIEGRESNNKVLHRQSSNDRLSKSNLPPNAVTTSVNSNVVTNNSRTLSKQTELNDTTKPELNSSLINASVESNNDSITRVHSTAVETVKTNEGNKNIDETDNKPTVEMPTTAPIKSQEESTLSSKKISSLLKYDIITAAQARGSKVQTKAIPPLKKKPKDAHEVFKDELVKACTKREDSRKNSVQEENISKDVLLKAGGITVTKKRSNADETKKEDNLIRDPIKHDNLKIDVGWSGNQDMMKRSVSQDQSSTYEPLSRDRSVSDTAAYSGYRRDDYKSRQRETDILEQNGLSAKSIFSEDWTPECDLSDSDLDNPDPITSRWALSDGFKPGIVPNKVSTLQKNNAKHKRQTSEYTEDKANKYGSLRRIKHTVRKGVINAFDSISKGPGKLIKKQRPQDTAADVQPVNWTMHDGQQQEIAPVPSATGRLYEKRRDKKTVDNAKYEDSDDGGTLKGSKISKSYSKESLDEVGNERSRDEKVHIMRRAGVAYVGGKGEIVLLPDFETVELGEDGKILNDDGGRAPKIFRKKKKKFAFEATVRQKQHQERDQILTEKVRENELYLEAERQKQMELEREFRRVRFPDKAHVHHHRQQSAPEPRTAPLVTDVRQQQSQQAQLNQAMMASPTTIAAPINFQTLPNLTQMANYSNWMTQPMMAPTTLPTGMGLGMQPQLNPAMFTGGLNNNLQYERYLTDYMAMLGNNAAANQQIAYMVNNVNWTGAGFSNNQLPATLIHPNDPKYYPGLNTDSLQTDAAKLEMFRMMQANGFRNSGTPTDSIDQLIANKQFGSKSGEYKDIYSEEQLEEMLNKKRSNPVYYSSDEDDRLSEDKFVVRSSGKSELARIQVHDYRNDAPIGRSVSPTLDSNDSEESPEPTPPSSPSKLYGHPVYRPVKFGNAKGSVRYVIIHGLF